MSESNPTTNQAPNQAANQMPAENPLDQLRDIHLPDAVDQFPYAPGWWILLAIVLFAFGFYIYRIYQYKKAIRLLKPAKLEIEQLKSLHQDQINAHSVANLSGLLKRVCLIYYPSQTVASLNGSNWWNFLNLEHNKKAGSTEVLFSEQAISFLTQAPYQKNSTLDINEWKSLVQASEAWIENLIKRSAKNKKGGKQ